MSPRRWPLVAVATLLALALTACGGRENDDDVATDGSGGESSQTGEPTDSTSSDGADDAYGDADEPTGAETDPSEALPTTEPVEPETPPQAGFTVQQLADARWAPGIVTDGAKVTGLDFADTPKAAPRLLVAMVDEGDGPAVEVGQTLTVDYYGSVYGAKQPFDSSFGRGAVQFPIGVGQLIQGWDKAIPGIPVGSRIIMAIPPELGYGDYDQPGIPAGSTLYFVIDVLAAS